MKTKKECPFIIPQPRNMRPCEQIASMVWLADSCSLDELRERQDFNRQQLAFAEEHDLSEDLFEDLDMIQDNLAASVAYKTLEGFTWMGFIKY